MTLQHRLTLILFTVALSVYSQQTQSFTYQPSFAAVIVKDINQAVNWYQAVFDLTVRERIGDEKTDYKVVILESKTFTLELLQLKGSIDTQELLKGKPDNTYAQGHFKIGFQVADMNGCLQQLEKLNVKVPRVYTDNKTQKRNFLITDPDGNLIQFFEQ
jgi:predicted enzyme related to lactoylglutathione lyase